MSTVFQALYDAAASAVEVASASVVRVEGRQRLAASGIVWSADGLIVTSNHGVERDEGLHVGLADGSRVEAALVGRDPGSDLALLRVASGTLVPGQWVEVADLRVGHLVLALGRPGATVQATLGIISALGPAWRTGAGSEIDAYLQTDVVMYPGFSGGPLVAADGLIAGLNTSAMARGVSLAIPAATVRRVVETLVTHGRVPRGYLGVGVQPVRLAPTLAQTIGQETGLMVLSVESDGPAAGAGLLQGDVIVGLAGDAIRQMDDLQAALMGDRVGASVPVRIVRSGSIQEVQVTVGARPANS